MSDSMLGKMMTYKEYSSKNAGDVVEVGYVVACALGDRQWSAYDSDGRHPGYTTTPEFILLLQNLEGAYVHRWVSECTDA